MQEIKAVTNADEEFLVALEVDKKSVTYKGSVIEIQSSDTFYVRKGGDDKENLKLCNFCEEIKNNENFKGDLKRLSQDLFNVFSTDNSTGSETSTSVFGTDGTQTVVNPTDGTENFHIVGVGAGVGMVWPGDLPVIVHPPPKQ